MYPISKNNTSIRGHSSQNLLLHCSGGSGKSKQTGCESKPSRHGVKLARTPSTAKHPAQHRRENSRDQYQQTSLFASPTQPTVVRLTIEPVPSDLCLSPSRRYLVVVEGDRRWHFPIQFTEQEIRRIFPRLQRFDWTLKEGEYFPAAIQEIYEIVESLLDSDQDREVAA